MPSQEVKKILLVPLDWGLGHTTRCIPIIRTLLNMGHMVYVGGTSVTNTIVLQEFPDIVTHAYPSYGITYPSGGTAFMNHIIRQLPRLVRVIRHEKKITADLAQELDIDIIISDNRFGVRYPKCKNIFISHQIRLSLPQSTVLQSIANRINRFFINKFSHLLIPDNYGQVLSGSLSSTAGIGIPIDYLGSLSRWKQGGGALGSKRQLLVILSGPEPQRTLLEDIVIRQSKLVDLSIHVVRGKPEEQEVPKAEGIQFYNHLSSTDLQKLAEESEVVISRAGYSTIMDLVAIKKHAILIPTPGQTEQEYLAQHLEELNLFRFYNQQDFSLTTAIADCENKKWKDFPNTREALFDILKQVLVSC